MKSNDEEYLDSLLSSAQSNNNPQSALSRMASKGMSGSSPGDVDDPENINELVNNSGGNEDLKDIGEVLNKLDSNEIIDEKMGNLLDSIEKATDPSIPQFTVGGQISSKDTRDPEEIALDES